MAEKNLVEAGLQSEVEEKKEIETRPYVPQFEREANGKLSITMDELAAFLRAMNS
jgi:hypothetical protein